MTRTRGALVAIIVVVAPVAAWAARSADGGSPVAAAEGPGLPAIGDVLRVHTIVTGPDGREDADTTLAWSHVEDRVDRFGRRGPVAVVVGEERRADAVGRVEATFAPGGFVPVTLAADFAASTESSGLAPVSWRHDARGVTFVDPDAPGRGALCYLRAGWQGASFDEIAGRALAELCPMARASAWLPVDAPLEDAGEVHVDGRPARHYRAVSGDRTAEYWFFPGVPYPARVRETAPLSAIERVLVGYRAGGAPLPPGEAPLPPATRAGVRFDAPGRWGVHEGDLASFGFPPGDAQRAIAGDPGAREFVAHLSREPTARAIAFGYHENATRAAGVSHREPTWWFVFNDVRGDGWRVEARRPLDDADARGTPSILPVLDPVRARVHAVRAEPVRLPPLVEIAFPERVIRLDDAVSLWRTGAGGQASRAPLSRIFAFLQPGVPDSVPNMEVFSVGRDVFVGHAAFGVGATPRVVPGPTVDVAIAIDGLIVAMPTGAVVQSYSASVREDRGVAPVAVAGIVAPRAHPRAREGVTVVSVAASLVLTGGALGLAGPLARTLARHGAVPLATRLAPGAIATHPVRARLLLLLREEPGLHHNRLVALLGIGNGALRYHVEVLERAGLVRSRPVGRYRVYFAAGHLTPAEEEARSLLRLGSLGRVLVAVREAPGVSLRDLAARVGLSAPATHKCVERLVAEGYLARRREGRRVALIATVRGCAAPARREI